MIGTAKTALLFTAMSIVAFAAAGGDVPEDRMLYAAGPVAKGNARAAALVPSTPARAAPAAPSPAELCPRLRDGHWLRAIVVQENHRHFRFHGCYYGLQAELERQWYGY